MKQYLPKKPTKRGFKIWVRADSRNGFFCDFEVYVGKSDDRREHGLGGSVVMKLSETIAGKNHHIYCDNYFTSTHLLLELLDHKLYCCGTTNMSRRGFLKSLVLTWGIRVQAAWKFCCICMERQEDRNCSFHPLST